MAYSHGAAGKIWQDFVDLGPDFRGGATAVNGSDGEYEELRHVEPHVLQLWRGWGNQAQLVEPPQAGVDDGFTATFVADDAFDFVAADGQVTEALDVVELAAASVVDDVGTVTADHGIHSLQALPDQHDASARDGVVPGEIPGNNTTGTSITPGSGWISSQIDSSGDTDWIAVQLQAGETYSIRAHGSGHTSPVDTVLTLYSSGGTLLATNDDAVVSFDGAVSGSSIWDLSSHVVFQASATGTYYIQVAGFGIGTGEYTLLVDEAPGFPVPVTALTWGGRTFDNTISVYFAGVGETYDGVTSVGWEQWQIDQTFAALETFSEFTGLTFSITNNAAEADFKLVTEDNPGAAYSAYFNPPGTSGAGIGVWNVSAISYLYSGYSNQWNEGSGAWHSIIHEFGHALGLAHPHDRGGLSNVLSGVGSSTGDYGDFDLNQGPFTMMSYNYSYATGSNGPTDSNFYGRNYNAGTFDVSILQRLYGTNATHNSGNTTYQLPANNTGVSYVTIWDTGGVDSIIHNGSTDALIDLRAATLLYETGGGGYVSYADGVYGGFVIANGVVIEQARGGSGSDTLIGNSANNVLNGAGGSDHMSGGAGNDIYVVAASGDVTEELLNEGTDTVRSYINWTLANHVERLELLGGALNGTGNALNNTLVGNSGNNVLNGAGGNDYIVGGTGNDIYVVAASGDKTVERLGEGTDTVRSYINWTLANHVERLELLGSALNGTGNSLNNTIIGNNGNNVLNGAYGRDYLVGGAGADKFVFNTTLSSASNVDRISDFQIGQDSIVLHKSIFLGLSGTILSAAAFVIGSSAQDSTDRIMYDSATGALSFDQDGNGSTYGAVQFATLNPGLALTADHFLLV